MLTVNTIIGPISRTDLIDALGYPCSLLPKTKELYAQFRDANIQLTKKQLKESVKKDIMIIQAADSIYEIDKAANLLAKRLREWYAYYCPEFSNSIESHEKFAELIISKSRDELILELGIRKEDVMGGEIEPADMDAMLSLARQVHELYIQRSKTESYIETEMQKIAPNITAVVGGLIGAKLLSHAGSLRRLATLTSSTIQVLGAEKALFRHMKFGAKAPKHGVILMHPLLQKARNKGRAARAIADKIAIAAKVDFFKGDFIGDRLSNELEMKLQ